jgi:hypothetical protein
MAADEAAVLAELVDSVAVLRNTCRNKQTMLWQSARRRTKTQKGLHVAAGVIALFSGGAITSVLTAVTSSLIMKIIAAGFAFLSGMISLLTTTLFDTRETERMFDGATQYAILGNRAQSLLDRNRTLSFNQVQNETARLTENHGSLIKQYDSLLSSLSSEPRRSLTDLSG